MALATLASFGALPLFNTEHEMVMVIPCEFVEVLQHNTTIWWDLPSGSSINDAESENSAG